MNNQCDNCLHNLNKKRLDNFLFFHIYLSCICLVHLWATAKLLFKIQKRSKKREKLSLYEKLQLTCGLQ